MAQWTSAVGAAQLARLLKSQQDRPAGPGTRRPPAYRSLADGVRLLVLEGRVPVAAQVPEAQSGIQVVDSRFVRAAHARGLQVHVWTINEPERMHRLLDLGVDGIMTDHIDTLRKVMEDRGVWA